MASQDLRDAMFIPSDNRANFKQIIAKRSDQVKYAGGRMAKAGAGLTVTYEAGLVVGLAATGGDAGRYKPYASGNTDGSQVAVGILSEQVVTDEFDNGSECVIIRGKGITLFQAKLIGLDAGAITNLGGVSYAEHGVTLLDI